jgi:hypothetical protein
MKSAVSWVALVAATVLTGACGSSASVAPAAPASSTYTPSTSPVTQTSGDPTTTPKPTIPPRTTVPSAHAMPTKTSPPVAYNHHGNARFGFFCDVPANFRAQPAPQNGDGFGYESPDGQAQILCFAQNNVTLSGNTSLAGTNARQAYAQALASHRSQGDSVTYSALVGNAITVSGISRDSKRIYYERIRWGVGSVDTLLWSYPSSMADQLQAAVEHSAATFRPGDLSSSH